MSGYKRTVRPRRIPDVFRARRAGQAGRTPAVTLAMAQRLTRANLAPRLSGRSFLGSATMLMRRRKQKSSHIQSVRATPGLTSHSKFKLFSAPSKQASVMKKAANSNIFTVNSAVQRICGQGFQNADAVHWNSQADLKTILSHIPTGTTVGLQVPVRYVLESMDGEILFTNSTLATGYLEIYDIVRKRDANQTMYPSTNDPVTAWAQGIKDNQPTGSVGALEDLKTTPFDSRLFKDWFKVLKRTRLELSQGATHRHAVILQPNKIIDSEILNYVDGDASGLACYTVYRFYGQPASIPQEVPPNIVTTASITLDVVDMRRYKYTYVVDQTRTQWIQDNLSTLAGEHVVSVGAGEIVPNSGV